MAKSAKDIVPDEGAMRQATLGVLLASDPKKAAKVLAAMGIRPHQFMKLAQDEFPAPGTPQTPTLEGMNRQDFNAAMKDIGANPNGADLQKFMEGVAPGTPSAIGAALDPSQATSQVDLGAAYQDPAASAPAVDSSQVGTPLDIGAALDPSQATSADQLPAGYHLAIVPDNPTETMAAGTPPDIGAALNPQGGMQDLGAAYHPQVAAGVEPPAPGVPTPVDASRYPNLPGIPGVLDSWYYGTGQVPPWAAEPGVAAVTPPSGPEIQRPNPMVAMPPNAPPMPPTAPAVVPVSARTASEPLTGGQPSTVDEQILNAMYPGLAGRTVLDAGSASTGALSASGPSAGDTVLSGGSANTGDLSAPAKTGSIMDSLNNILAGIKAPDAPVAPQYATPSPPDVKAIQSSKVSELISAILGSSGGRRGAATLSAALRGG